jgi:hypothetical protein
LKGIDYVIRKTAAELNLPEDKVKPVVMEYWETIYKRLLKLETTTITARHLGNFTISRFKLNIFVQKSVDKIRRIRATDKLSNEKKDEIITDEYKRLRTALARRNELAILFKDFKEARKEIQQAKKKLT